MCVSGESRYEGCRIYQNLVLEDCSNNIILGGPHLHLLSHFQIYGACNKKKWRNESQHAILNWIAKIFLKKRRHVKWQFTLPIIPRRITDPSKLMGTSYRKRNIFLSSRNLETTKTYPQVGYSFRVLNMTEYGCTFKKLDLTNNTYFESRSTNNISILL